MKNLKTDMRRAIGAALIAGMFGLPANASGPEESEKHQTHVTKAPNSIAAAVISVSDLDAATEFYTQGLGLTKVRSSAGENYKENILATEDETGTKLVLIQTLNGEAKIGKARVVFNTDDAAGMMQALKTAGMHVERDATPISKNVPVIIGIGHDADGNTLEFIQRLQRTKMAR